MTHLTTLPANSLRCLANVVHQLKTGLASRRRQRAAYNATFAELAAMSNHELVDIGLSRGDIPFVAAEAAAMKR